MRSSSGASGQSLPVRPENENAGNEARPFVGGACRRWAELDELGGQSSEVQFWLENAEPRVAGVSMGVACLW